MQNKNMLQKKSWITDYKDAIQPWRDAEQPQRCKTKIMRYKKTSLEDWLERDKKKKD